MNRNKFTLSRKTNNAHSYCTQCPACLKISSSCCTCHTNSCYPVSSYNNTSQKCICQKINSYNAKKKCTVPLAVVCRCKKIHYGRTQGQCAHVDNKHNKCNCTCHASNHAGIMSTLCNMDNNIKENIDFVQEQINDIKKNYLNIIQNLVSINEQNVYTHECIDDLMLTINKVSTEINSGCSTKKKIVFSYEEYVQTFVVMDDEQYIFLTMVAGGGAGGVGSIDNLYYYSGGGGGAGGFVINKPIQVVKGTIIKITIGKGSDMRYDEKGGDTVITIIYPEDSQLFLTFGTPSYVVYGGSNGYPNISKDRDIFSEKNVSGGIGGTSFSKSLSGDNGADGMIALPSSASANGGSGGSSILFQGGAGGGNIFSGGGNGGIYTSLIGDNGIFGSGGGGSAPKSIVDSSNYVSGKGGDGLVIIDI